MVRAMRCYQAIIAQRMHWLLAAAPPPRPSATRTDAHFPLVLSGSTTTEQDIVTSTASCGTTNMLTSALLTMTSRTHSISTKTG